MKYYDLILTNHAQDQILRRGVRKEDVYDTLKNSTKSFLGKNGGTEFHKWYEGYEITVFGKKNEKDEWVVISAWRNPPLEGTKDAVRQSNWNQYKKAGTLGRIWLSIKGQLGF